MEKSNTSVNGNLARVEGLRLVGRVNRALAPVWRPAFSGVTKATGKPFTLPAHAEVMIQMTAGEYLVACTMEFPECKSADQLARCDVPKVGEDVNLGIVRIQSIDRNGMAAVTVHGNLNAF